jgi:serine O-acetyltransferase
MKQFVDFLLTKVYQSKPIPNEVIQSAFTSTCEDVLYHFPSLNQNAIINNITTNCNELAIFLFRLGNELHKRKLEELKPQIHWLLKELCSCEIYFNNEIATGFYIVHGEGTVIGSRNRIGKGFIIHQGCTIGHRKNGEGNGNDIGNNVKMYANSSIIGNLFIGNQVVIGANVLVTKSQESNKILTSEVSVKVKNIE